jgi:hypothetical protein
MATDLGAKSPQLFRVTSRNQICKSESGDILELRNPLRTPLKSVEVLNVRLNIRLNIRLKLELVKFSNLIARTEHGAAVSPDLLLISIY